MNCNYIRTEIKTYLPQTLFLFLMGNFSLWQRFSGKNISLHSVGADSCCCCSLLNTSLNSYITSREIQHQRLLLQGQKLCTRVQSDLVNGSSVAVSFQGDAVQALQRLGFHVDLEWGVRI
jgi:hypothetical protein